MEKHKNIPALRFPEFNGEWERKKLEDFAPLQRGFDLPVDKIIEGIYPVVFSNGILKYHIEFKAKSPGIVTGRSGTIGNVTYVEKDYWPHNTALWVTDFKGNQPKFIYYFFLNYNLERFGTGSGVPTLNRNDVHVQVEYFPSLPEQTRIASFLTAVDEKLTQLKKKKTLLEQYKKGVMQQLFSQQLRFKQDDGSEFPEWEEKRLGEIAFKKSSNIAANTIQENFGDYIIYGASGILKKIDFYREETDYISIVKDGAGVGRVLFCNGKSSVLGTMDIIKPKLSINIHFLFSILSNLDFVKYVTGSTIPHIYFKDYSHEVCSIPIYNEQTKIANFLSAIDEKISHCRLQIEKMELWKKGLLQRMFI